MFHDYFIRNQKNIKLLFQHVLSLNSSQQSILANLTRCNYRTAIRRQESSWDLSPGYCAWTEAEKNIGRRENRTERILIEILFLICDAPLARSYIDHADGRKKQRVAI